MAVMNNERDLALARDEGWYRIPERSAPKELEFGWLAFYLTKAFRADGLAVQYLARVTGRSLVTRVELMPAESKHPRALERYHRIAIAAPERLAEPIRSKRGRRLVFIPTTLAKLRLAREVNDLFHESPLEDELWTAFKQRHIEAERQWYLPVAQRFYCLDFALFCRDRAVDVECDGDTWHSQREQIAADNERDNALTSCGWSVLRFNTRQVREDMGGCLGHVIATIARNGGLVTSEGGFRYPPSDRGGEPPAAMQEAVPDYKEEVD